MCALASLAALEALQVRLQQSIADAQASHEAELAANKADTEKKIAAVREQVLCC